MDKTTLIILLKKLDQNTITPEELEVLEKLLANKSVTDSLFDDLDIDQLKQQVQQSPDALFAKIQHEIVHNSHTKKPKHITLRWVASSVAVLFLICSSILVYNQYSNVDTDQRLTEQVIPGSNKAQILLADGRLIDLESLSNDTTLHLEGYSIIKNKEGLISYQLSSSAKNTHTEIYNEVVTPKGGEYTLQLADGTRITLNAMSSLRYPVSFASNERKVELLSGEAYFEVNKSLYKSTRIPFIVHTKGEILRVLGTVFNINSYEDLPRTTLVEGSVLLSYGGSQTYLKPNQQASRNSEGPNFSVKEVDPNYEASWRNGRFSYDDADLKTVMKDIARWYDIEVVFADGLPQSLFSGSISRFEDIDKLLRSISLTGTVKFKREGRMVIVYN